MAVEQRLKLLFFCFQGSPACARCTWNIILFIYLYYVLVDVYQDVLVGSVRVCACAYFLFFYYGHRVYVRARRVRVGAAYLACVCAYILFNLFNLLLLYIIIYTRVGRNFLGKCLEKIESWVEVLPPDGERNGSKISKNTPIGAH